MLGGEDNSFSGDDGSVEPRVAAALAAFATGQGTEHVALMAITRSRLLVPVVAAAADGRERAATGGERASEMSLPTLVGRDGRRAVPVFTCLDALVRWRRDARPSPAAAGLVWRSAAEDSCAVVVDIAGPVPLTVDGARLAALASGRAAPLPHDDPDVLTAIRAAVADQPVVTGVRLSAGAAGGGGDVGRGGAVGGGGDAGRGGAVGGGGDAGRGGDAGGAARPDSSVDLVIHLTLAPGSSAAAEATVRLIGSRAVAALGTRLRRGIAIAASPGASARRAWPPELADRRSGHKA